MKGDAHLSGKWKSASGENVETKNSSFFYFMIKKGKENKKVLGNSQKIFII
jgi:hypothetical protein